MPTLAALAPPALPPREDARRFTYRRSPESAADCSRPLAFGRLHFSPLRPRWLLNFAG